MAVLYRSSHHPAKPRARSLALVGVFSLVHGVSLASPLVPYLVRPATVMVRGVSGLPLSSSVPVVPYTLEQAREHLERELDEQLKGVDMAAQVRLSAAFGFLPADLDVRRVYLDMFTTQAAAFYDTRTGKFHNLSRGDFTEYLGDPAVVAHELTHAAQDQAVPAQPRMDLTHDDDDRQRAIMWVMEGQATLVGNRAGYMMGPPLPGPLGYVVGELSTFFTWTPLWRKLADAQTAAMGAGNVPPFMQDSLLAPYVDGSRFTWTVERILGRRAHHHVLCHPPDSTEQLLHPEKYLRRDDVPLDVRMERGTPPTVELVQGEWALRWWLARALDEQTAERAAAGWGGDRMALWPDGTSAWRVVMDTDADAGELESAARRVFRSVHRRGEQVIMTAGTLDAAALADVLATGGVTRTRPDELGSRSGWCGRP